MVRFFWLKCPRPLFADVGHCWSMINSPCTIILIINIQVKNNLTNLVFEQSALFFIPGPSIPPRIAAEFLFLKVHFDLVKEIHK